MPNRIIVPAHFDFELIIKVDTNGGQSELQIRNRSHKQVTMWQIVGLLIEHASTITKSLLTTGKVIQSPLQEQTTEQSTESKVNGGENAS